jgi:multidrug resistance efflux pump
VVKEVMNETGKTSGRIGEVKELQNQVKELEKALDSKNKELESFKTDKEANKIVSLVEEAIRKLETLEQSGIGSNESLVDASSDRPQVEGEFIDPLEKGSGDGLELFTHQDNVVEEQENLVDKVSRLKNLLGKSKEDKQT